LVQTVKGITQAQVVNWNIPLPPLPIQHKIVEILDEADHLRKLRQQAGEKMKELIPALFVEMFGDPATNPKGWEVKKLGEVCGIKGGKRLPKGQGFAQYSTPHPYIRVVDFDNGTVNMRDLRYLEESTQKQIRRYIINKADVYISIAGTIGIVGIIPDILDGANLTENAARLVISDITFIAPSYLAAFLNSPLGKSQIKLRTNAVGKPKLALEKIATIEVQTPPITLQQEYALLQKKIRSEYDNQAKSKHELDALFDSLMHQAFSGELVQ